MSRVQLALHVDDVGAATELCAKLFGVAPATTRPGYANFAIADPPLKLILLESPGHGGTLSHLGVEAGPESEDPAVRQFLTGAGRAAADERETTCCHITQDRLRVSGSPGGESGVSRGFCGVAEGLPTPACARHAAQDTRPRPCRPCPAPAYGKGRLDPPRTAAVSLVPVSGVPLLPLRSATPPQAGRPGPASSPSVMMAAPPRSYRA